MSTRKRMAVSSLEKPSLAALNFGADHVIPGGINFPSADARLLENSGFRVQTTSPSYPATKKQRISLGIFSFGNGTSSDTQRGCCTAEINVEMDDLEISPGSNSAMSIARGGDSLELCQRTEKLESSRHDDASSMHQDTVPSSGHTGHAFEQLTIDGMFARQVMARSGHLAATPGELQRARRGKRDHKNASVAGSMENRDSGVTNQISEGSEPSCNVCRRRLENEGGSVLCSFCILAACRDCSQACFSCQLPHCRLCVYTDYTTEVETYFCPPCHRDQPQPTATDRDRLRPSP